MGCLTHLFRKGSYSFMDDLKIIVCWSLLRHIFLPDQLLSPFQPVRSVCILASPLCTLLVNNSTGQVVVRVVNGSRVSGMIVETESYLGGPDVASHSHNGKRTARTEPMYMRPGTSYVYSIYGMYHCFNISSQGG